MTLRPDRLSPSARKSVVPAVKKSHRQLAELKFYLRSLQISFEEEYQFLPTRRWRFDLAIPALKIAIEYQGHGQTGRAKGGKQGAHIGGHASITGLSGDCEKDLHALLHGWRVLKFTALHFTPAKRLQLKLTSPLDAIRLMIESIPLTTQP